MNGAQVAWIIIQTMGLGIILSRHGKYEVNKNNFWTSLLAVAIEFAILKWGGFF